MTLFLKYFESILNADTQTDIKKTAKESSVVKLFKRYIFNVVEYPQHS